MDEKSNTRMRLQILYDAFQTTMLNEVRIRPGVYLEANFPNSDTDYSHCTNEATEVVRAFREHKHCHMCLMGAMALKLIAKMDDEQLECLELGNSWDASPLTDHFDVETLATAEALFEGYPTFCVFADFWDAMTDSDEGAALDFYDKVSDISREAANDFAPPSRARAILNHLIENEGKVNLDRISSEGLKVLFPGNLSTEALAVLRRYDIIPYTEKSDG
jgi:hypothetical protein